MQLKSIETMLEKAHSAVLSDCFSKQFEEAQQFFSIVKSTYENEFTFQHSFITNSAMLLLVMKCEAHQGADDIYNVLHFFFKTGDSIIDFLPAVKCNKEFQGALSPNESDVLIMIALRLFKDLTAVQC